MKSPYDAALDVISELQLRLDDVEQRLAGNMDAAEFRSALSAVYGKARTEGYSEGFDAGMAERRWLSKSWPLFTLALGLGTMCAGVLIGMAMP